MSGPTLSAQSEDWRLWRDRDGIRITYKTQASGVVEILAKTQVSGTAGRFIALLNDTDFAPEWLAGVKKVQVLDEPSPSETLVYTHLSAPWPVADRDFVSYSCFRRLSANRYELVIRDMPGYLSEKKGRVRIPELMARWQLNETEGGLQIRYRAQVDPGGSVPDWISNNVALGNTYKTLKKLKTVMGSARYKDQNARTQPGECPMLAHIEG